MDKLDVRSVTNGWVISYWEHAVGNPTFHEEAYTSIRALQDRMFELTERQLARC